MNLTPPRAMTTEQRITEIAQILLRGCQRIHAQRREQSWKNNNLNEFSTGLQCQGKRPWTKDVMEKPDE